MLGGQGIDRLAFQRNHGLGQGQVVPRKGLEPSRPLSHWHLKPARLPIPPPGPGPVSTDRSRACQIDELLSISEAWSYRKTGAHFSGSCFNALYSSGLLAYRETAK